MGRVLFSGTKSPNPDCRSDWFFLETAMKQMIFLTAILSIGFAPAAEAKGCIKGAIVGGVAGHLAGHGKVGAVAGCIIGHHEANKPDAEKSAQRAPPSTRPDNRIEPTSAAPSGRAHSSGNTCCTRRIAAVAS